MIDTFYKLGMSILFDRLLTISSNIERYEKDRVVCHFKLGIGIFTPATVNNIGPNTSSTSSQDSFHSTAVSLVQHPKPGTERCTDVFDPVRSLTSRKTAALPSYYTDVPPAMYRPPLTLPSTNIVVPNTSAQLVSVACEQALRGTLVVGAGKRRRACNYISGI